MLRAAFATTKGGSYDESKTVGKDNLSNSIVVDQPALRYIYVYLLINRLMTDG
jgi:hypothetical protein